MISTNQTISIGNSVYQNQMSTSALNDVIVKIKKDENLKTKVESIRSCDDKDIRTRIKTELPYLNLGTFKDGLRNTDNFLSTNFMILDLDKLSEEELIEVKK